jgi:hypothetical protein
MKYEAITTKDTKEKSIFISLPIRDFRAFRG